MRPSSLAKRQRYLDSATRLFLEQGYEHTGLDQLIEECGGSKLTLYNYFGDKKGLLEAVVVEMTGQLQDVLSFEPVDGESIRDQLIHFSHCYLRYIYNPDMLKLIRLVLAQSRSEPELAAFFTERTARYSRDVLQAFLEGQLANGGLQLTDTFTASEQLLGALKGNRFFEALFVDRPLPEPELRRYAEQTVDQFLEGQIGLAAATKKEGP